MELFDRDVRFQLWVEAGNILGVKGGKPTPHPESQNHVPGVFLAQKFTYFEGPDNQNKEHVGSRDNQNKEHAGSRDKQNKEHVGGRDKQNKEHVGGRDKQNREYWGGEINRTKKTWGGVKASEVQLRDDYQAKIARINDLNNSAKHFVR